MADQQQQNGETPEQGNSPASFEDWLLEQPEQVQALAGKHTQGLKSALDAERQQRKDLAKQLKELERTAEQGSEAARTLGEMSAKLEAAERVAAFYRDALQPEIGCANPRAAFLVAQADGLFTRSGEPDWKAIRAAAPELFRQRATANGGVSNTQPPKASGMNEFIRAAAGRS